MWSIITAHKKASLIAAIVAAVGIGYGAWALYFNKPAAMPPKITESKAKLGAIAVAIENDGVVRAEKAVLNFSQTGVLNALNVKVGDSVSAGDTLAALNGDKLWAQVNQAQANYSANLSKADRLAPGGEELVAKQVAVNTAETALGAEQAIYNDVVAKYGVGSTQELAEVAKLRKAEADVATAKSQLAITEASYNDAKYAASAAYASVAAAQASLYDLEMTAPMSGVVTSVNGSIGQAVGGSQTAQNGFITIANPKTTMLVSQFDEEDIAKISVGQAIRAEFASLNTTLDGQVAYVSPVATVDQNGTVTYEVRSNLALAEGQRVFDGMTATVKFITKEVKGVVVVPNKAVTRVDGKSVVSYYDEQGKIATKPVVTGFTDGKSVAITKGLSIGDVYLVIE